MLFRCGELLCISLCALLLVACASVPDGAQRTAFAERVAVSAGLSSTGIGTSPLVMRGFARMRQRGDDLVVYLEGDGRAWISRTMPSTDPTPVNPVALKLAVLDPSPNLAYLGRPGQYGVVDVDPRYWLGARFSRDVVKSYLTAIRALATSVQAPAVHLVGYSGGGAIAALVAAELAAEGVPVTLRTVAGNLDIAAWVQMRRISPLEDSLNPADFVTALEQVPQIHLAGLRDRQVPAGVLDAFLVRMPRRSCVQVISVDADHAGPWEAVWRSVLAERPACLPSPP